MRLDGQEERPVSFAHGQDLRPAYSIRSGENGIFSVANADALYRVMRVASTSELGLMLAGVALLGDDPGSPWFPGQYCNYAETDNSRHLFDFLNQPYLLNSQLSGLDPMALQDLGSAKHQAELHLLGLMILVHRLRTLDLEALDPDVDPQTFDAERFFVANSRHLTFDDVAWWSATSLADDLSILVGARNPHDLVPLLRATEQRGLLDPGRVISTMFEKRDLAVERLLRRVLEAVWAVPSLGTPIVFRRAGEDHVLVGYYVAPVDLVLTDEAALARKIRDDHRDSRNSCALGRYRDWLFATHGFLDVRPHAIVSTARAGSDDLDRAVARYDTREELLDHLRRLPPYSMFSTCGIVAALARLQGLHSLLQESMIGLGSLQDFRWNMPRDGRGHLVLVPGVVECLRMVAEGLEKATGTDSLDGAWGYERRTLADRRTHIDPERFREH